MEEFESERCPVCQEKIGKDAVRISEDFIEKYKEQIYVPGEAITIDVLDSDGSEKRREIEEILRQHDAE